MEKQKKSAKNTKGKKKVIFVCTGNTCRSPMAEKIFSKFLKERGFAHFQIKSAGICAIDGDSINPLAKETLRSLGIKQIRHAATRLNVDMVKSAYRIICLEKAHKDIIEDAIGSLEHVKSMGEITNKGDIIDPYGMDISCYIHTATRIADACEDLLADLESEQKS